MLYLSNRDAVISGLFLARFPIVLTYILRYARLYFGCDTNLDIDTVFR